MSVPETIDIFNEATIDKGESTRQRLGKMKIKIYSDEHYLLKREGIRPHPMLLPFYPHLMEKGQYPWLKKYDNYTKISHELFEMTSLKDADFAVMPDDWKTVVGELWYSKTDREASALYSQFAKQAEQAGKPLIVFFGGDRSNEKISTKDAIVFRHSHYHSRQKPNNFVWPSFSEDIVEHYLNDDLPIRQKTDKPVVGFKGLVKKGTWKTCLKKASYYAYTLLNHGNLGYPPIQGHLLRAQVIELLENSPLVETNFALHDRMVFLSERKVDRMYQSRLEFVENIVNSDYVLCCRGAGNFSFRLFESLCCGRIPVFVNTDCALVYDNVADWKKYCVWVEEHEISHIADKIADFHNKISPADYVELQYQCRKFWKEWLSPEGFFSKFHLHFQQGNH